MSPINRLVVTGSGWLISFGKTSHRSQSWLLGQRDNQFKSSFHQGIKGSTRWDTAVNIFGGRVKYLQRFISNNDLD